MELPAMNETERAVAVASSELVMRQWCIEKSIQWCGKPDDQTQTDEMIDQAALIERYIKTGEHSRMITMSSLESAMQDVERCTKNVSRPKAKAVCDEIMGRVSSA
jgi:hypothetical protein